MAVKKFKIGAMTREPKYGFYGIKVDGTDTWINVKDIDGLERGATVEADVVKGKGGKLYVKGEMKVSGGGAGKGGASGGKGGGGSYSNVDWNAATARAIEAADLLIRHDAAKLGAKTKVEERKVAILDLIDELTVRFFKELTERNALKKAKEIDEDLGETEDEESDDLGDDESFGDSDDDDPFA